MKEIKPLVFEELTLEQKLGLVNVVLSIDEIRTPERDAFLIDLIKNHRVGGVWVHANLPNADEIVQMIRDAADYPILIFTDVESGIDELLVGKQNTIGCTDSVEHAYNFGKLVGIRLRKRGYNVHTSILLDTKRPGSARCLGSDPKKAARLAEALVRGYHDAGVLAFGKHYPSGIMDLDVDTHMAEATSSQTEEELIEQSLYPYKYLIEKGLLDGIMTNHWRFVNIDPEHPATLSKKMLSIIRERFGFDGIIITDALCMMGIRAKYGFYNAHGLAIEAGNDLALPFAKEDYRESQQALIDCYNEGIISPERLDEAVKRVLAMQERTLAKPKVTEITEEDLALFEKIHSDSLYAKCDEGLTPSISRDGKHFFAVMVRNESSVGGVAVDTFNNGWLYPQKVKDKILELFPNSKVEFFHQFPSQEQNEKILGDSLGCDELVFLTFCEPICYTGPEHLTRRTESLINAMQLTNRISTLIHFGNPTVLGNLSHIPRYILGFTSEKSIETCLEVLAGEKEPNGKLTYDVTLN